MLTDKLVGIDMIENDIVDEMEQEVQDPDGVNNSQTPGNTAGGPSDHEIGEGK